MLRRLTALTLLPAAVLLVGCGSGSSSPSDSAFVAKLSAFCTASQAQINAVASPSDNSVTAMATYLQSITPILEHSQATAEAIKPSSAKATEYTAMLANAEQQIAVTKAALASAQGGDANALNNDINKLKSISTQGDQEAKAIGASACASS